MRGQGDEEYRRQLRSQKDRLDRLDRLNRLSRRTAPVTPPGIGFFLAAGLATVVVVVGCLVALAFILYAAWYTVDLGAPSPFDGTTLIALYCAGMVPWLIECYLRVRAYRHVVRDRPRQHRHPRRAAVRSIRTRIVLTMAPIWTFFLGIEGLDGHVPAGARLAIGIGIPAAQGTITYLIWRLTTLPT